MKAVLFPSNPVEEMVKIGPAGYRKRKTQFAIGLMYHDGVWHKIYWAFRFFGKENEQFEFKPVYIRRSKSKHDYSSRKDYNCSVSGSLTFTPMAGYIVQWEEMKTHYYYGYYYNETKMDNRLNNDEEKKGLGLWGNHLYDPEEVRKFANKTDPDLKYAVFEKGKELFDEILLYKQHPEYEMLVKGGYSYLGGYSQLYKLSPEKKKQLAAYIHKHPAPEPGMGPTYPAIAYMIKYKTDNLELFHWFGSLVGQFKPSFLYKLHSYLVKERTELKDWKDYRAMLKKCGIAETDQTLMPKNLSSKMEKLNKMIEEKQSAEFNKKLLEVAKQYSDRGGVFMGIYKIEIPSEHSQFTKWGNFMDNCVASLNYDRKMADGGNVIVFISKDIDGKTIPWATAEIDKEKRKIYQLRLRKNGQPDEDTKQMFDKWLHKKWGNQPKGVPTDVSINDNNQQQNIAV